MNRRNAIRHVMIISAGASLLPACTAADETSLPLKNISLNGTQEKMLAALAETIIPKTTTIPGAGELESHVFLLIMIDDCNNPEQQQLFTSGMRAFEDACHDKFNTAFIKCSVQQKNELLKEMEAINDNNNTAVEFYKTVKRYTIQSFTSSKPFLVDIRKWKMVPGNGFKGCVPV